MCGGERDGRLVLMDTTALALHPASGPHTAEPVPATTSTSPTTSSVAGAAAGASRGNRVRYVGVDLARFLAIAGMMATHLVAIGAGMPGLSAVDQQAAQIATVLTLGIAAPLFAVLGGLSTVFATRRLLADGRTGTAMASVALRGAILVVLGLLLGFVPSPIVIVLVYYGVAMMLIAPLVAARSWVLASLALVLGVVGGPLNAFVRGALGVVEEAGSPSFMSLIAQPVETLRGLLLTGAYPAITWVVYLLVGMLFARALVAATERDTLARTAGVVAGVGVAVAVAASLVSTWVVTHLDVFGVQPPEGFPQAEYLAFLTGQHFGAPASAELWSQLIAAPHSGSPLDIVRTAGIALAVIGVLVAIFDTSRVLAQAPRSHSRLTEVIRAAGAAPLTIYTAHVLATAGVWLSTLLSSDGELAALPWWVVGVGAFAVQLAGVLVIGAILAATGRRGPLEALTSGTVKKLARA